MRKTLGKLKQILVNKQVNISDLNKDQLEIRGLFDKHVENENILVYNFTPVKSLKFE